MRGRLAQLLDIKRVQHEPALSVERWDEAAVLEICERWIQSQRSKPSIVGISRLMALNFERARPHSIPAEPEHQRLLPKGTDEQAYYREMIATFLKTVGLEDTNAVIDSFKKAGTGGLHRQRTVAASAVSGAFSVAQLAASANLPAKTALSAVQMLMTALTTKLGFESANLRFRNSGTEEIMPLGKADAPPTAKTGPHVMQAAARVAWDLRKIGHAVQKMESAQTALDDARARLSNPSATAEERQKAEKDLHAAGQTLSIAYASYCMRAQLKADYKTASESAKIEYHGNKRALGVGVASSAATMTATVLGVLTPVVVSAAVTAGATAAAAALAATLYVGFQLSSGPSKDGEDKAKRAIVALAKSLDLLAGNAGAQQKARATAYRTYIAEKRAIGKPQVRKQAKEKLLAKLDEIARRDTVTNDLDPVKNWKDYAVLRRQVEQAGTDATAVAALEAAFAESHASQFKASTLSDAWKTPERMRFDSMGRVLLGKVTESLVSLHDFNEKAGRTGTRDPRLAAASRAQMQGRHAEVKASLRDWLHFELAQSRMKAALAEKDPIQARATLQTAAQALAAIENHDARDLFSNDARKQVEATKLAKARTIGERERYTMTNAGPTALAGTVNAFGATAGLALTIQKDIAASHGIHTQAKFGDQNDARVFVQGSAPVTAPYSAAERARFQKTGMSKLVSTLARDPVVSKLDLAATNSMLLDLSDRHNDAALDKLLSAIERSKDVPDEIEISIGGVKLSSAKLSGTTGYYDWRYRQAPFATKAKFATQQAKMFFDSVRVSVVSPVAQAVAQIPLAATRRAVDRGNQMNRGVRERLTGLATGTNASDVEQQQAARIARDTAQQEKPSAAEDSIVRGDAPPRGEVAGPTHAASVSDTSLQGDSPARDEMPIGGQSVASVFDPREAALALRDIPELGHSARIAQGEPPAARPQAAFRPRPAQSAPTHAAGERETNPALDAQRDLMMGAGRDETLRWFEQRGISAAYNSGHGMDCLIISLLQHATGRYDLESEPELAALAARYRTQLAQTYPEIEQGDRMLYDDEPAVEALIRAVNRDYHADMNVQLVMPRADGPTRFQVSELGTQPVGIVMFGNHFQAVHKAADAVQEAGRAEHETAADPRSSSRDARGARSAGEVHAPHHASPRSSATTLPGVRKTGGPSPDESLGSRVLSRADETRVSGLAAERARRRLGAGRRTSEASGPPTLDKNAFVHSSKRDSQSVRQDVQGRLSTSSHRVAFEPHDDGFVSKPKRDKKAARESVEAWLSANFGPRSKEPREDDGFDRAAREE
ncbi:MAG TPA: type III effector protein [Trinickia sp.]|uniref:type III effector protein n=1 Tax=Trinickia sp. TaxID=2571163 RepID=UPI002B7E1216|nr:type III effector protein [Trinickia sp.]HVW50468.1 type III effector protein [Trinickia sp.]